MSSNPIYVGEIVEVVNRTSKPLEYVYNGRRRVLKPGSNMVTDDHLKFAIQQNILRGSGDPYNPSAYESLVGVPSMADRWPCDAIPDALLDMLPSERLDRTKLPANRQKVTEGRNRDLPRGRAGIEAPTPGMLNPGRFGGTDIE